MFIKKSISRVFSVLFVIVFTLAVTPLQAVHAANVRYSRPSASGTGNCSSWANACTLQAALTGAVSSDEIWAAAGTYKPTTLGTDRSATFQLIDGVALYGGFAGTETARNQRNLAANVTILSGDIDNNDGQTPIITNLTTVAGNTTNSYHVVTGATGATLDGFTITAGNAGAAYPNDRGGGIYDPSGNSPTLTNVTFSGNIAFNYGGGMYNVSSSPTLTNVIFSNNSTPAFGGGMYNDGSNPTLTNVTFSNNTASERGGGMLNASSSNPTLTNVAFSANSAGSGGGMYNGSSSSPTLTNVTFSSNPAVSNGGGMYNEFSSPTLTNITFSANSATSGGGMYNTVNSKPTLTNVTINGNSANFGGGMLNENSNPRIIDTIFWGNTAASAGGQIYNISSIPVVIGCVVQSGCPAGSTCTGTVITADPLLGALGNYGGFTQTIPLLAGSSAIDADYSYDCSLGTTTDQRGVHRPQGARCDIGAFEFVYTPPPTHIYLPLVIR